MSYAPPPGDPHEPDPSAAPTYGDPVAGRPEDGHPDVAPGYPMAQGHPAAQGYPMAQGYPAPYTAPTNSLAVASLVVSIAAVVGLCGYGLGGYLGIVGAVLGHVSRRQIRDHGGSGEGLALAGVIAGWIATAVAVIATVVILFFVVWAIRQNPESSQFGTD